MRAVRLVTPVAVAGPVVARCLVACVLGALFACAGSYRPDDPRSAAPPGVVDLEQYRLDLAHQAREQLRARWLARGAIPRPPMPPLLAEEPGEPPFPQAIWVRGTWEWSLGRWRWRPGYWTEPDVFVAYDDPGIPDLAIGGAIGAGFSFGLTDDLPAVRDHRGGNGRNYPTVRDHRDRYPAVRDHRDRYPAVRDHRKGKSKDKSSGSEPWYSGIFASGDNDSDDDRDDKKQDRADTGGGRFLRPH